MYHHHTGYVQTQTGTLEPSCRRTPLVGRHNRTCSGAAADQPLPEPAEYDHRERSFRLHEDSPGPGQLNHVDTIVPFATSRYGPLLYVPVTLLARWSTLRAVEPGRSRGRPAFGSVLSGTDPAQRGTLLEEVSLATVSSVDRASSVSGARSQRDIISGASIARKSRHMYSRL